MINYLSRPFFLFSRIVFTRLSSALVVLYAAMFFPADSLGRIAICILLLNANELFVDGGLFESLIKEFRSVKLKSARTLSIIVATCTSFVTALLIYLDVMIFWSFVLSFCLFLQALISPVIVHLKFKNKSKILYKLHVRAGVSLVLSFFICQVFSKTEISVVVAYISYYSVLFFYLRKSISFAKIQSKFFKIDFDGVSALLFKLTNFLNSRIIEIAVPIQFGVSGLSNYVAGSRLYNILNLFCYTLINELSLKKISDGQKLNGFYVRYLGIFVFPVYALVHLLLMYSDQILFLLFSGKFSNANEIFSVFCFYLGFQVTLLPLIQLQMVRFSIKQSAVNNAISCTILVCVLFAGQYTSLSVMVAKYINFIAVWYLLTSMYLLYKIKMLKLVPLLLIVIFVYLFSLEYFFSVFEICLRGLDEFK